MKLWKNWRAGFLTALLLAAVLSGCGQDGPADSQPRDGTESAHAPVTIVTGGKTYAAFVELLKETHPEVNLEFISYAGRNTSRYSERSLESGEIADIFSTTIFPSGELQQKYLIDLSDRDMINNYTTAMLDAAEVDGGIYLLPAGYTLTGIAYNKTILEENNWPVPQSFQDLLDLAPLIREAGYQPVNMNTRLTGATFGAFFGLGSTNFLYTPEGVKWKSNFLNGSATAAGALEPVADYMQKWIDAGLIDNYYYTNPDQSCGNDFKARKFVFRLNMSPVSSIEGGDQFGFLPYFSEDGTNNMLVRQISRYYGLNKTLAEPGNEQKLEDALKVLELMNTPEGYEALSGGDTMDIAPLKLTSFPEDSVYNEVVDLIQNNYIVDAYGQEWEPYVIPVIERYGTDWIDGKITSGEFLAGMDIVNEELRAGDNTALLASCPEGLSREDTARLIAIAEGRAAGADAAVVSLGAFHGFADGANVESRISVSGRLFPGEVLMNDVNMIADTTSNVLAVQMSGKELNALVQGGLDLYGDGNPFSYFLAVKGGGEIDESKPTPYPSAATIFWTKLCWQRPGKRSSPPSRR